MSFPFENRIKLLLYAVAWMVFALLYALSMSQLIAVQASVIVADTLIHTILFAALGILLWNILRFGDYERLSPFQQAVNYLALGVLAILVWIGLGYLLEIAVLTKDAAALLLPFIPLHALIGLLLYAILILLFRNKNLEHTPVSEENADTTPSQTETLILSDDNHDQSAEILERIVVKIGQKIQVVPVSDILYLQSDGDYVHIVTLQGKYLKEQTMKYFETHLPAGRFVRIHRSYIVNIESISRIELYTKQNQLITLKNGEQLKVSAAGYKMLRTTLGL
jgi:hypothetical protein